MHTFVFNAPSRCKATRVDRDRPITLRIVTVCRHEADAAAQDKDKDSVRRVARELRDIAGFAPRRDPADTPAQNAARPAPVRILLPNQIEEPEDDQRLGRDSPPLPDFGGRAESGDQDSQDEDASAQDMSGAALSGPFEAVPTAPSPRMAADGKSAARAYDRDDPRWPPPADNPLHAIARSVDSPVDASDRYRSVLPLRNMYFGVNEFLRKLSPAYFGQRNADGKLPREVLAERHAGDFAHGARARALALALFDHYARATPPPGPSDR